MVCVSALLSAVLPAFARAVWPGTMVSCCGAGAAVSSVEMGFWVCSHGGGSSRARAFLERAVQTGVPLEFLRQLFF